MQPRSLDAREEFACFGRISGPSIGPQWDDGDNGEGDSDEHKKKNKDDEATPPTVIAPEE